MLTPKQNFLETIRGGNPDRFVKQYEFFEMPWSDPFNATNPAPTEPGQAGIVDFWGVTWDWPEGTPGAFPNHTGDLIVLEDVCDWREVHQPTHEYAEDVWAAAEAEYGAVDRTQKFVGPLMFPGLFELTHALMGMEEAMCAFYSDPDEMHEMIESFVDTECAYVEQMGKRIHPDLVFHHDDWGSSISTFLSPDMFKEFYLEPYKRLYKCYKDNGFEIIVHHSDSFAATLVPFMIEMGIDVWQGGTYQNDIPNLVKEYGGDISFMTGIDSMVVDRADWSQDEIARIVEDICTACGTKYFIPCQTQGIPESTFPGVAEAIDVEIDRMSAKLFG